MKTKDIPKTLFRFIFYFLKKQWLLFLLVQIFAFAWTLDFTLWPRIIMQLVDALTNYTGDKANVWSVLTPVILKGVGLWILCEFMFRMSGILNAKFVPRFEASVRMEVFDYVQHHSQLYMNEHFSGSISNKITDITQSSANVLSKVIFLFLPVFAALIIATVGFFFINPILALILTVWVFCHLSIAFFFASRCANLADQHAEARSDLSGKIVDVLTNHSAVRLFARYAYENRYLAYFQADEVEKHRESLWYVEKMKILLGLVAFLGAGLAMNGTMIYFWQQGSISAGAVVYIFNTMANMTTMAWLTSLELPGFFKEIGVCSQALSLLRDKHEITDIPEAKPLRVNKGEIIFDNVFFRYGTGLHLFENRSLKINAGEKVGLVGFSGAGKSTFVQLILRSYDVEKGAILIDGQDIRQVTQESLRNQIAFIPQDPILFHRTLLENIRYGNPDATDEEILQASAKANCTEFIQQMPEGYNTLVGERGVKLSGGQRQRIAIARAILKDAPILILDEATSALDSVTERLIQTSMLLWMKNKTTIVIAHRLSTLAEMDRILVLDQGKIIEEGTHAQLIALRGHYAMMWRMQSGGFLPEAIPKT